MERYEAIPSPKPVEVGDEFMSMTSIQFMRFLNATHHDTKALTLNVDLSSINEIVPYMLKARQVKAFMETVAPGQKRTASIRATDEQLAWESNVFTSGVDRIKA